MRLRYSISTNFQNRDYEIIMNSISNLLMLTTKYIVQLHTQPNKYLWINIQQTRMCTPSLNPPLMGINMRHQHISLKRRQMTIKLNYNLNLVLPIFQ